MAVRLRLAALVALLAAAAVALAVVALARDRRQDASARTAATASVGALRPPGIPPGDFTLRDERGRRVRLSDYRGRVIALMFVYSTCRDTCPLTAQQVRGALDQVGRRDVGALAISVDPAADTRAHVRRFLAAQRIAGRVPYLVGTPAQLAPVWRRYGVAPQRRGREHAVSVVLLDRAGRQRVGFGADDTTADGIAHDLRQLARERRTE
jgi:protein SCO1/2